MVSSLENLERLFAPTSVAVVGASTSPDKAGSQALLALEEFPGDVFPINPKAKEILGRPAFPSLRAVGRPVDLVVFAIPAAATVAAVSEAIDCGCGGGLVLSGGFAESGEAGAKVQTELGRLVARSRFRLLGPNTAGFINCERRITASFLAGARQIPGGDIAVVAQSAGVNLTVSFLVAKLGFGVSCAIGLGNAIDVDAADALEFLAGQDGTRAIALHLEGVAHGRRLYDVLKSVTPRKPVVALTVGRQDVGEFAHSHTGNLIGSFALRSSALRQAGAVVVDTTEELAAAAAVLSLHRLPPKLAPGIGVLTAQAGPGLLVLDHLKSRHVAVPQLSPATLARIGELLPGMTYTKNPVDTGRPSESFWDVLSALGQDPQIDAVVAYALDEPAALRPLDALPATARRVGKPVVFGTMGPRDGIASVSEPLRAHRIYVAESPEGLARAATVLAEDAARQARLTHPAKDANAFGDVAVPRVCHEAGAKQVLESLGIDVPRRRVCCTREEAGVAFRQLGKPVAVKLLSAEVTHKTELGAVRLDIADEEELWSALSAMDRIALAGERCYLLEEMAAPGLEVIVGAMRDASFGPSVMVGLGGTFAEALDDTATRVAPLSLSEAAEMIDELRGASLFDGFRGGPKLDRAELARTIVRLGDFLCNKPYVSEMEINPLRVYPQGVVALDALLITQRDGVGP